jgi:hypothetical protein
LFRGFLEVLICKVKGKRREGAARKILKDLENVHPPCGW